jgi:hypothetical protein
LQTPRCAGDDGTPTLSDPQISWADPLIISDIPMVKKIRIMMSFDRACRMGPISIRAPMRATPTMDRIKETAKLTLKITTREYINIPPRDINSHWAKLTIPVAL